jgi:hypothetical protein
MTDQKAFFQWLLKIYVWLLAKAYDLENLQGEIKIMANYIVKDDNPDVGVKVTVGGVTDSEGQPIDNAQLTIKISSSDDSVLGVTDNGDGSGSVHFGAPGQASTQYEVSDANGKVLGSGSDGFTVTTGDPAAITGVTAQFDTLTPVS